MIDPYNVDEMLYEERPAREVFLLFCIAVAGKNSNSTAHAIDRFIKLLGNPERPLEVIAVMNEDLLMEKLVQVRLSPYRQRHKAFIDASKKLWNVPFDDKLTVEKLESVYGIGPKTARFFLLNTVPGFRGAALDTHILRFLKDQGYYYVPKITPKSGAKYARLEGYFLQEADKRGKTPAELDLFIWTKYSREKKAYDAK